MRKVHDECTLRRSCQIQFCHWVKNTEGQTWGFLPKYVKKILRSALVSWTKDQNYIINTIMAMLPKMSPTSKVSGYFLIERMSGEVNEWWIGAICKTMTRNKMRVAIESGKGMKVKVVKLCWNKWNGPFLCISMTNNVESCKKINGRVQTFRFSVFTMGRQELCAK